MRRLAILPILLLAGCKPSFDDRYDKAEKDIRSEASGVDDALANQQAATPSATAEPSASPSASAPPPAR